MLTADNCAARARRRRGSIRATPVRDPAAPPRCPADPARPGCARQPSWSWLNSSGSSWGPAVRQQRMAGDQGIAADQHAVDDEGAMPAGVAGGGNRHRLTGQAAATSSVSACVGRDAVAHHSTLAGDRHRPLQPPRLPDVLGDVGGRHLLQILAFGVPDLRGVAIHRRAMGFREPDRRPEVIDMRMRQQDRAQVVDAEPEFAATTPARRRGGQGIRRRSA